MSISTWSPVSIGKPAPKIHQWTIYFCRWGFGWVIEAQCCRSAKRFDAAGSSPNFPRFSRHGASRPLSSITFPDTIFISICSFSFCCSSETAKASGGHQTVFMKRAHTLESILVPMVTLSKAAVRTENSVWRKLTNALHDSWCCGLESELSHID